MLKRKADCRFFSSINLISICFLGGVLLFFSLPNLPSGLVYYLSASLIVLTAAVFVSALRPVASVLIGFTLSFFHAIEYKDTIIPQQFEKKNIELTGTVSGIPAQYSGFTAFEFLVDEARINQRDLKLNKVKLKLYRMHSDNIRPGAWLKFTARLKRPHGLLNPDVFDYERWLFSNRISATGYVKTSPEYLGDASTASAAIDRIRFAISRKIDDKLKDLPLRALVKALLIGFRKELTSAEWEIMQKTGTGHLLAISGLHLGLVAIGAFFVFRKIFYWISARNARHLSFGMALGTCIVYALLAGFAVPTQRALIMLAAGFIILTSSRQTGFFTPLALALLLILVFDPFIVLAAGFWLSFAAVFLILLVLKSSRGHRRMVELVKIQFALSLGLAPILMLFFLPVSWVSIPANLLIIPLVSFILLPLIFLSAFSLLLPDIFSDLAFSLTGQVFGYGWEFIKTIARVSPAAFWGNINIYQAVGLFSAVILLIVPRGIPVKFLTIILLAAIFLKPRALPEENKIARVTMLDVGQGLSVLVETRTKALLYDTGAKYLSGDSVFKSIIGKVLQARGIKKLDKLIISHMDNDHSGGMEDALALFDISSLMANDVQAAQVPVELCEDGKKWVWDGVEFAVLHPPAINEYENNNSSCVVKISTGNSALILTGDIEKKAELDLIQKYPHLRADVLLLAHHGSKTSSSTEFLAAINPRYALVSSGYMRKYFPHESVVTRMNKFGIKVFNTAHYGAVSIKLAEQDITINGIRDNESKLWNRLFSGHKKP